MQEDEALKRFVAKFANEEGQPSWADVANAMAQHFDSGHRNTKACRERWFHHLRPGLTDAEWTPAEEVILFQLQALHGNKWTNIAEHLPGRSDQVSGTAAFLSLRSLSCARNEAAAQVAGRINLLMGVYWSLQLVSCVSFSAASRPAESFARFRRKPRFTSLFAECQKPVLRGTATCQPPEKAHTRWCNGFDSQDVRAGG